MLENPEEEKDEGGGGKGSRRKEAKWSRKEV
jgi:hypothetical protein